MTPDLLDQRLRVTADCGVYFQPPGGAAALSASAARLGLTFVTIDLVGCGNKHDFLGRMARALRFPDWFGHNWDALADCLSDLEWLPADGYVLLLAHADFFRSRAEADFVVALEILQQAARGWADDGIPMWVFVDLDGNGISHLRKL